MENNFETPAKTNQNEEVLSLLLAECWPGGPIVTNPKECLDIDRDNRMNSPVPDDFPSLTLTENASSTGTNGCGPSDWRCLEKVFKPNA